MKNIHSWKTRKDTGKYLYLECEKCGDRSVKIQSFEGYQAIDFDWTKGRAPRVFCPK